MFLEILLIILILVLVGFCFMIFSFIKYVKQILNKLDPRNVGDNFRFVNDLIKKTMTNEKKW